MHQVDGKTFYFSEATVRGGAGDSGGPVVSGSDNAIGIYAGIASTNPAGTCGAVFGGGGRVNSIYQGLGPYLAAHSNVKPRIE